MADPPLTSVIIPTHERRDALRRALTSLARQTDSPDDYEVVVAIDHSTDGTREMLMALSTPYALRVTTGPRRGRAAACNAALERARGEVVIVLDDDMQVSPEFVERHRRHHPPRSRVCVLGSVPVRINGASPLVAVRARFDSHLARLAEPGHVCEPRDFYTGNPSSASTPVQKA